jgi:hypothetical protein
MFDLRIGDLARMKRFQSVFEDCEFSFSAGRGEVAVFLFLGKEKLGKDCLVAEQIMNRLGWYRRED